MPQDEPTGWCCTVEAVPRARLPAHAAFHNRAPTEFDGLLNASVLNGPDLRVDQVDRAPALQDGRHILGCFHGHLGSRLPGSASDMRKRNHIRHRQERMGFVDGLMLEYIKTRSGNLLLLQRPDQRRLIDNSAAGGVDEIGILFISPNCFSPIIFSVCGVRGTCTRT